MNDGVYQQTGNGQPDWSVATSDMNSTSIIYTLKARKAGGAEGFLIIFGYQDSGNYYWWNLGGWGNTQHAIEKAVNGTKSIVASTAGSIETDIWYDIKIATTFNINGGAIRTNADLTLLTGSMTARNTMDAPDTVVPEYTSIDVGSVFDYEAPPMSVQVMRIKTRAGCRPRDRQIQGH